MLRAGRVAIGGLAAATVLSAWGGVAGAATSGQEPVAAPHKAKTTVLVKTAKVGSLGTVVVTRQRFTLYFFVADKPGAIACLGSCVTEWAPLLVPHGQKTVHAAKGLTGFGAEKRPDGKLQVTFHGMALYRFAGDTHPGDANGEGVAGLWFAVHPDGTSTMPSTTTSAPPAAAPPMTAAPAGASAGSTNQNSPGPMSSSTPSGGTPNSPPLHLHLHLHLHRRLHRRLLLRLLLRHRHRPTGTEAARRSASDRRAEPMWVLASMPGSGPSVRLAVMASRTPHRGGRRLRRGRARRGAAGLAALVGVAVFAAGCGAAGVGNGPGVSGATLRSYVDQVERIRLPVNQLLETADPILGAYRDQQLPPLEASQRMGDLERRFAVYLQEIVAIKPSNPVLRGLHAPYAHTYLLEDSYLSALAASLPDGTFADLPKTQNEQRLAIIEWRTQLLVLAARIGVRLPVDLHDAGRGEIAPAVSGG